MGYKLVILSVACFAFLLQPAQARTGDIVYVRAEELKPDPVQEITSLVPKLIAAKTNAVMRVAADMASVFTTGMGLGVRTLGKASSDIKGAISDGLLAVGDSVLRAGETATGGSSRKVLVRRPVMQEVVEEVKMRRPTIVEEVKMRRPTIVEEVKMGRPTIVEEVRRGRPTIVEEVNMRRPTIVEEVKMGRPTIVEEVRRRRPTIVEEVKMGRPTIVEEVRRRRPTIVEEVNMRRPTIVEEVRMRRPTIVEEVRRPAVVEEVDVMGPSVVKEQYVIPCDEEVVEVPVDSIPIRSVKTNVRPGVTIVEPARRVNLVRNEPPSLWNLLGNAVQAKIDAFRLNALERTRPAVYEVINEPRPFPEPLVETFEFKKK